MQSTVIPPCLLDGEVLFLRKFQNIFHALSAQIKQKRKPQFLLNTGGGGVYVGKAQHEEVWVYLFYFIFSYTATTKKFLISNVFIV